MIRRSEQPNRALKLTANERTLHREESHGLCL
jgi:hypothetical protein